MVAHAERRPIYVGEDPQAFARAEATADVVDTLARALAAAARSSHARSGDAVPD